MGGWWITEWMAPLTKTEKWAEQAIEPFDQNPLEVKALLNAKVACLFLDFSGHLFHMHIKEKINGTMHMGWVVTMMV